MTEAAAAPVERRAAGSRGQATGLSPAAGAQEIGAGPGTQQRRLQGFIDQANPGRITGWVWDPQEPRRRVTLELVYGDTQLIRVVASQYRADLGEAGIGDGQHAFTIPLPRDLLPNTHNLLHLRCADTGAEVPGSPITVVREGMHSAGASALRETAASYLPGNANTPSPQPDDTESDQSPRGRPAANESGTNVPVRPARGEIHSQLEGNVDVADWTGIRGWVRDPDEPQKRVALELLDGSTPLATIVANQYRPDLEQNGVGDGRYGFAIAFSSTLLSQAWHILHLRPVGSGEELAPFPLELTREAAGFDASVQLVLTNVVTEAERAQSADGLAPTIAALIGFLDAALARYFALADEASAGAAELLNPAELTPQFRNLVESVRWHYPRISLPADRPPLISIIIPAFNKFDLTYACIRSIASHGAQVPFEIVVVDDCSRDETMLACFAFGSGIQLIRNSDNLGFIRSCNRGFDAACGEFVVFLNNDTEVKPRWLDELYETISRDPKIGVVGAKLLYPDGSLQESGGIIWRLGDAWNWGRGQAADDPRFCYLRDADYVSGAALMIKASLFAEIGKFDEHYLPAYYEDTELCFQARQRGYRVVVQPAAQVVHFEGASAGTSVTGTGMKRFQAINHRKFFERWKDALATHRFNGELPEFEAERSIRQRAVFIDDSVPEPDKDAGSTAAFQHMLSLQRLGYKVTFIPGDNMARIDPYTAELQRRGIECLYHPYFFSVEDVFRKRQLPVDLVYLHRYSNASKYAGMVRQHFPAARVLYNVADLHFLRKQRQAELEDDARLHEEAERLRRLELGAMSFVDCVIVHSEAEAELLRQLAPDIEVRVIPWTVPVRELTLKEATKPVIAFIGGYRHPPNVDAAKWAAQSIMPLLRRRVPGIELLLVGSNMPPEVGALAAKDIIPLGYVPSLDGVLERVQATIAPLRYGAGLKGKVLESLAAGVPCVMTPVSAEGVDLPPELQWLVADDADGLAERIAALCHDKPRHWRAVEAGKAHVAANYSSARIDAMLREACSLG